MTVRPFSVDYIVSNFFDYEEFTHTRIYIIYLPSKYIILILYWKHVLLKIHLSETNTSAQIWKWELTPLPKLEKFQMVFPQMCHQPSLILNPNGSRSIMDRNQFFLFAFMIETRSVMGFSYGAFLTDNPVDWSSHFQFAFCSKGGVGTLHLL